MPNRSPEKRIRQKALELGFDRAGIAPAEVPEGDRVHFESWLANGYAADMDWMARTADKRKDPALVVPGARSVLCLYKNYRRPEGEGEPQAGEAKISRYAWGQDYHNLIEKRLKALYEWIVTEWPDCKGRYYVDAGPVLEKALAQRAGLGWIGKHANLINRDDGSWFFLAEIILTMELEPDAPAAEHCGDCRLCLEACPTNAIVAPWVVDGRRCISYQTIEKRGQLDADVLPGHGEWVFGCDICQEVCPWNRAAAESDWPEFAPGPMGGRPRILGLLEMDEEAFRRAFDGGPVKRAKWRGLVRNAIAAAENLGVKEAVAAIRNLADHEDETVRTAALDALSRMDVAPKE